MKKFDIVTALDICVDLLVLLGDVVPEFGQKEQMVGDYKIEMGGSCCIFACQAAKLGLKVKGIGTAAQDNFGDFIIEKLAGSGVDTDSIKRDHSLKTGIGVALCKSDGDRAILTYERTIDGVSAEDMTDDILSNTRHIHIGSYFLLKRIQPFYPSILEKAKKYGVTVSLDTNWDPEETWDSGIWNVMPYVDVLTINEAEAKFIARSDSLHDAVQTLRSKVPVLAVKMGERGAALYAGDKEYHQPAMAVRIVDTTGAGDSFDAGLLYGMLSGLDYQECLRIGCLCGSCSTREAGGIAGQIGLKQLKGLMVNQIFTFE